MPHARWIPALVALAAACATTTAAKPDAATTGPAYTTEDNGGVDPGIAAFLDRSQAAVSRCYASEVMPVSDKPYDDITLQFVLGVDGSVERVIARESTITNATFKPCIEQAMATEKVPTGGKSFAVSRSYRLTANTP